MCVPPETVAFALLIVAIVGQNVREENYKISLEQQSALTDNGFYKHFVEDIRREQSFESILLMQPNSILDLRIIELYKSSIPRIIYSRMPSLDIATQFSKDIIAVIIMEHKVDQNAVQSLAHILDYMRQSRILLLAVNFAETKDALQILLKLFEKYKMTNVLIHFSNSEASIQKSLYRLKPYPTYHMESVTLGMENTTYFMQHWRNMQGTKLLTLPDQHLQNSIVVKDKKGQIKISGVAAKLIFIFAEKFNASLVFSHPVKMGENIHTGAFLNLTDQGRVHMPMSIYPGYTNGNLQRMSYPLKYVTISFMVPCSQPMLIKEVFTIIVSKKLLIVIFIVGVMFSLMDSTIAYVLEGHQLNIGNIFNVNVVLGILGQSFVLNKSSFAALKILYFQVFLLGLVVNSLFGAQLNTLITAPPLEHQIESIYDLTHSKVKILFDTHDITDANRGTVEELGSAVVFTSNYSYFQESRRTLNTAYGYAVSSGTWQVLNMQQLFFSQRIFCKPPGLTKHSNEIMGVVLEKHSPLKEPLDHLIQCAHSAGLISALDAISFLDMVKYKVIPLTKKNMKSERIVLNVDDLFWVWMLVFIGLATGIVAFLGELLVDICTQIKKNDDSV